MQDSHHLLYQTPRFQLLSEPLHVLLAMGTLAENKLVQNVLYPPNEGRIHPVVTRLQIIWTFI